MTDAEKKEKGLKTGKGYGLYPDQIRYVHTQARLPDVDVSDSQYVEALIKADMRSGGKIAREQIRADRTEATA